MPTLRERIAAAPLAKPAYRGLLQSVRRSGVPAALREITGRRHVILTFHRVRAAGEPADPFDTCGSVSVDYFRQILDCVRDHYAVVSLDELYDARCAKSPLAAITFDDGWRDNYDVAFPVLRELGVPATIFVVTGKVGRSEAFWQEDLGKMFRAASESPQGDLADGLRSLLRLRNGRPFTHQFYRDTVVQWKNLKQGECFDRLRRAGWTPSQYNSCPRQFLTADEIREMAAAGVRFGSHGVTHRILPRYGHAEIERELRESKAALESILGHAVDTVAYPDGRHSPEVVECAASCGYRLAVTTQFCRLSPRDHPLRLPRIDADAENLPAFLGDARPRFRVLRRGSDRALRPLADDAPFLPYRERCERIGMAAAQGGRVAAEFTNKPAVKPISILFLVDDFVGPEGGTEQHLLFLQQALPRDRFDLHFAVLSRIQRIDPEAFPVRPVMLGQGTRRGAGGALQRLRRLSRLIRSLEVDVVHAFCRRSEAYACLAVKSAGRGRVLAIRRNIGYWHNWLSRWTARMVGSWGAEYAANCEAAREFAARVEWISKRRVCVIPNPVSSKRLAEGLASVPRRSSLGILDGEQVVGMVATVRPIKDYATFLRAARLVLDRHPNTRFLAIGTEEPAYKAQMRQLARELNIDRQVNWLGPIPNPISVLPLFDVAVLSSRSEAFSNAVLEYAAVGAAIVATDVGGTREIIDDGHTGLIVPPQAPGAMAERICRLLADRTLRGTIGDNARRKVGTAFSEEKILREYGDLYRRFVGTHGS